MCFISTSYTSSIKTATTRVYKLQEMFVIDFDATVTRNC